MSRAKRRVAIVVSHAIQHFGPFYRALAADGTIELKVLFASAAGSTPVFDREFNQTISWQPDLLEGYASEVLPSSGETDLSRPVSNPHLGRRLDAFDPHVVQIYGFWHGLSRAAIFWAKRRRRRVLMLADSELRTQRPWPTRLRKWLTVPWQLRAVDGILTVGDANAEYYRHYGAPAYKLFRSPLPIDEVRLREAFRARETLGPEARHRYGLSQSTTVALSVGKLTTIKCVDHLIEAARLAALQHVEILVAGDGPERARLESLAAGLPIRFAGFVGVTDLPSAYAAADLLVHPSSADPHPLVTGEAAYMGLPLIVSDRVGSVGPTDDVQPGRNGIVYPFGDVRCLAAALGELAGDPAKRARMSVASRQIVGGRGLDASVAGFLRAVDAVTGELVV